MELATKSSPFLRFIYPENIAKAIMVKCMKRPKSHEVWWTIHYYNCTVTLFTDVQRVEIIVNTNRRMAHEFDHQHPSIQRLIIKSVQALEAFDDKNKHWPKDADQVERLCSELEQS